METTDSHSPSTAPFDLSRFHLAQAGVYGTVIKELRSGRKQTHWIWFIFPQLDGLGTSPTAVRYAIRSIEEARAFLADPILGARLNECCTILCSLRTSSPTEVLGFPDDMKLRSSMTLFAAATNREPSIFIRVLEKFFNGNEDNRTNELLNREAQKT